MAGDAVIGALRVVLGADTAQLDTKLKESQSGIAAFGKSVGAALTIAAAGVAAASVAIGASIKSAIDEADKVNKLSQSAGLTTEEFSKLKYAAELSDVSTEALGKSMGKLSKAMVETAGGAGGPAAEAFKALGISVQDANGNVRASSDVFSDIAAKFQGYEDGAAKTALAIAIFGKAGAGMIPLLNQGKTGLADAAEEAERYGLVLDQKTTRAAETFNDNLKRMDKIKEGLAITIAAKLLPSLEQMSDAMLRARENSTLMNSAADLLGNILKGLVSAGLQVSAVVGGLANEVGALWRAVTAGSWEGFKKGLEEYNQEGLRSQAMMAELNTTIANLWKAVPDFNWSAQASEIAQISKEVNRVGEAWTKTAAPIIQSENATRNALMAFLDSQAKRTAAQLAEAETIGKSVDQQARLRIEYEAQAIALAKNIPLTEANRLAIANAGNEAAAAALKVAAANVTLQTQSPAQMFQTQMDQLRQLYDAGLISLETFAARQQQIAEQAGATWGIAGAQIAGSFAQIATSFGKESSAMATAAKVFGVIQGTISMYTGAAKALELPFPANIGAMAAVLAKGASLVASIKGTSVPTGFKTGGSITVGGGGPPDSQLVQFMASPGEQIDIWRPDEASGDPRGRSGSGVTITVKTDELARPLVEKLITGINEAIGDGHQLRVFV